MTPVLLPCSRSAHDQNVLARRTQSDQHGYHPWERNNEREWPSLAFTARIERPSLSMLPPSLLVPLLKGWRGRSSNARVERAPSQRARSASRRTTRLPFPIPLQACSLPLIGMGAEWSSIARVQRGPSEAARCASTEDHQPPSSSLQFLDRVSGGPYDPYASAPSLCLSLVGRNLSMNHSRSRPRLLLRS